MDDATLSTADIQKEDVSRMIRFTIFEAPGSRLSKQYKHAADGSVMTVSGTEFAQGSYRVVEFDAADPAGALAGVGRTLDGLSSNQAIGLGVPLVGTTKGQITTKDRHAKGGTDAIPRSLNYFGWPSGPGLLLLDGDDIEELQAVLCEFYPPCAGVALLSRPSASASVIDPRSGKALKTGEHCYAVIDDPSRSKACLEALMRLAWCRGSGKAAGRLLLSKRGDALVRGPVDACVGSPERLSYEGATVIGAGLERLPRNGQVIGGTGMLCAKDLLEFAEQHAPAKLFDECVNAARNDPKFCARRDEVRATYRAEHIRAAVARGVPRKKAEESYDRTFAAGACKAGNRTFVPLPPEHVLYWPNGKRFTVADIQQDRTAFHGKECCDPVEGTTYQSLNCAIIYTNGPRMEIYSRAHGDAFAYVAPLDDITLSLGELLAQVMEAHASGLDAEADAPTASQGTTATVAEAWDPWSETPAPRLDHSLLPDVIRQAAVTSSRVSGADIDAFAIGYLVGLAACCDTRLRVTPKQHARDWSVPLLLWVLLVAPPSSMKTAVIKAARAMPASLDGQERDRHCMEVAASEIGATLGGAAMTRAEVKRARQEAAQKVAPPRQRVCGDVTIEKLADILGANPGGCAIVREELSGWLGGLGRYTANGTDAADRAFYCAMRDGSPHDRQRVSSPSVHIDHCAGSFLGAVQPDRLLEMKLPMADGLLQRFLPLIMREARSYEDSDDAGDAKALLRPVRDRLAALVPVMQPDPFGQSVAVPYKLTPEGAELYKAFADDMRLAARTPDPSREFGECLNKMGPMWLSLALLFHLIEASETDGGAVPERVSFEVARRADAIIREFFIPHAEQFYGLLDGGGSAHRVCSIASAILRCPKDEIVLRDVVHRCRVMREKERNEQIQLMQKFETFGWLTRVDRYGPAHPRWLRTPGLGERFAEELKREEEARVAVKAAIKADASAKREA